MPRLKTLEPATLTGRAKEVFDGPLKGKAFNIFKAMANSPAALDVYLGMSGPLHKGLLSVKEIEAIQLAVGEANGCNYCAAAHTAIAKGAGMSEAETIDARRGKAGDPKLDALIKFSLAIHEKRGFVSDQDVSGVRAAGYGDGHLAEIVAAYALAIYTNYFNHVNQTALDFPPAAKI
jgi:AhpD family alkylhydroperoxidase